MTQKLFDVERGLSIEGLVAFIPGSGAPDGVSGDQGTCGIGSLYLDYTTGALYSKKQAGTGANKWSKKADVSDVSAISWREPVRVADLVSVALPADENVDGVALVAGDRALFANVAGNKNVFVWDGAAYIEDVNAETAGDQVYVQEGTAAGKTYSYSKDGDWVQAGGTDSTEIGYLRAFVGKAAAGNTTPDYSSTVYVTDGDSLLTAVGKLDAALKAAVDALAQAIIDGDNAIIEGAGLEADGSYAADATTNYLDAATDLKDADKLLDAQVKVLADAQLLLDQKQSETAALLLSARKESVATNVAAVTVIDEVATQQTEAVKWIVYAKGNSQADAQKRIVMEVLAVHNGTTVADASEVDYTSYAKLKLGVLSNMLVDVDLSGAGAAQRMRLRVTSPDTSVDVYAVRERIPGVDAGTSGGGTGSDGDNWTPGEPAFLFGAESYTPDPAIVF